MEIYTYRARSLQEALMLVRHELGPEASIVQTREISGRLFGWLGKSQIEVQASRDARVLRRLPDQAPRDTSFDDSVDNSIPFSGLPQHDASDDRYTDDERIEYESVLDITEEHDTVTTRANRFENAPDANIDTSAGNNLSPAMFEVFTDILDADVDADAARLLLQEVALHCSKRQLNDPWLIRGRLCQLIQQRIQVSGPIDIARGQRQVVAMVGPTGVGKTTTLAKLAAGFHFDQALPVGFITLDTFRLGAVEQVQKYAELLGVPCEVVSAPDQVRPALDRLANCQLVLIDTAGRSPRDPGQIRVLHQFLQAAQPDQTHLVLSAASSPAHADLAIEQFQLLEPSHLLLTKLDEAACLGAWYRLLSQGTLPLSYLTTGQHVPEDILVASRRRVASLILGQSPHVTVAS